MRRLKKWAAHAASTIATKLAMWAYEDAEGSFFNPESQDLPAINAAVIERFNNYVCTYHGERQLQDRDQAEQDIIARMDLLMDDARRVGVPCAFIFYTKQDGLSVNPSITKDAPQILVDTVWPFVASGL